MPSNCCVPKCTKKGYRSEEGSKISYYQFPTDKLQRKKWIHAIRRDEGKEFEIKEKSTLVCSRHFHDSDFRNTLAGIRKLKPHAVPSVFAWCRTSPRKRNPPVRRNCFPQIETEKDSSVEESVASDESVGFLQENAESVNLEPKTKEMGTQNENVIETTRNYLAQLEKEIVSLKSQVEELQQRNEQLRNQRFSVERFKENNSAIQFYTGFQTFESFMAIFRFVNAGEKGENIRYYQSKAVAETLAADLYEKEQSPQQKFGRWRSLQPIEESFLTMCRLRQGFAETHLGHLFQVSQSTVSRVFITWIDFLYLKLGQISIWPSRETIDNTMPEDFKESYRSTRVILDCTEVRCEMPSSLHLNGKLFSSYKNHTTLKGLIGISPGGATTVVSQLYTGSISDREISVRSGFLELPFEENNSVMADKGFTIQDLLPLGVSLNIPPF